MRLLIDIIKTKIDTTAPRLSLGAISIRYKGTIVKTSPMLRPSKNLAVTSNPYDSRGYDIP